MKDNRQIIISLMGLVALILGFVLIMMREKTMFISPLILATILMGFASIASLILAVVLKFLFKPTWQVPPIASIILILFVISYAIVTYRKTHEIIVPRNYVGEVKLFVSNEKDIDFHINEYGIGYIDKETFDDGFHPRVIQGGKDITNFITNYAKGSYASFKFHNFNFEYLSFRLPKERNGIPAMTIEELVQQNAIDTNRLYR